MKKEVMKSPIVRSVGRRVLKTNLDLYPTSLAMLSYLQGKEGEPRLFD
jgi:hypothetical protein